ncbi:MAG: YebC/PmpR family DNA-binding transcriptional regulator [Spirochaetales bacterium]|jgi:YebC/PmpR family DNA-binding regulatory protein|nr:YebC/PmpR family DNA-binding transcriptional regulator [Spirochaetales bacterium]
MSGHSKWATIKHKKGAADAKRGQMFTKLIKEISIAARLGGGDAGSNPRLRTAVLKARTANMPKDNIDRAVKKGLGELDGVSYTEITYEAYGPGGVAILVDVLTDNKNRTAADIRYILSKGGGNLGESGSVAYLFKRKGVIGYEAARYTEDQILEPALEAGAEDVSTEGDSIEVITDPDEFEKVLGALEKAGLQHNSAEITKVADTYITLDNEKTSKVIRLIDNLDDHDDVQSVSSNIDIPDDYVPPEE